MVEQGVRWELQPVGGPVWSSLFLKDCILLRGPCWSGS